MVFIYETLKKLQVLNIEGEKAQHDAVCLESQYQGDRDRRTLQLDGQSASLDNLSSSCPVTDPASKTR